ncbi:MAG: hypothetical protein P4L73_05150 [Caulobacteraceae bacterium]|nr:hypothetical protein [Caulobacteraceae bacterium]
MIIPIQEEGWDTLVRAGIDHKMKVPSLLDRETGAKRSIVLDNMKPKINDCPRPTASVKKHARGPTNPYRPYPR